MPGPTKLRVGLCRPCFQMGCDNFHTFVSNYSSCLCSHGQRHWSYQKNDARCSKSWSPLCISFNLSLPTAALQKAVSGLLLVGWFLLVSSLYLFMAHLYTFVLVPAFYFSFNYSCTWAPLQDGCSHLSHQMLLHQRCLIRDFFF